MKREDMGKAVFRTGCRAGILPIDKSNNLLYDTVYKQRRRRVVWIIAFREPGWWEAGRMNPYEKQLYQLKIKCVSDCDRQ